MLQRIDAFLQRLALRRAMRRWTRVADAAADLPRWNLQSLRGTARQTRRALNRVLYEADSRLSELATGADHLPRQPGTDWIWRPDLWRGPVPEAGVIGLSGRTDICEGAALFHDCPRPELAARQIRNQRASDHAAYGLRLDVFGFTGSFLSLVLDLPATAAEGLKLRHLIRLDAVLELERPIEIFVRLNVKHGPNLEQIVRKLHPEDEEMVVEFDLAYSKINEKRVEKLWIDVIFQTPAMNQITLHDMRVSRRPRAEL